MKYFKEKYIPYYIIAIILIAIPFSSCFVNKKVIKRSFGIQSPCKRNSVKFNAGVPYVRLRYAITSLQRPSYHFGKLRMHSPYDPNSIIAKDTF